MPNINKLKSDARRAESGGEIEQATRLYLRAISAAETEDSLPDPGLRVRVGDLEHRQGDLEGAFAHYRQAVDLYVEQGLLTNAVAVCNKILRTFPDRHEIHSRLAHLHLDMGLTADARSHILHFADAASADGGEVEREARELLSAYLDREPDEDVAVRLADRLESQYGPEPALDLLERVARRRLADELAIGELERKAREIDPGADTEAWSAPRVEEEEGEEEETSDPTAAGGGPRRDRDGLGELGVLGEIGRGADGEGAVDPGDRGRGRGAQDPAHLEVLRTLARLVEHRDFEAEWHAERVGELSGRLAAELGFSEDEVEMMRHAAPLHDIGMVVVPDRVVLKEGELTPEERSIMVTHAANGARILSGSDLLVLRLAAEIAGTHHEQWDGEGYPEGLEGAEIPLAGRIVAVADAFESLTHDRPHRPARSVEESLEEIRRCSGSDFDPRVVDALFEVQEDLADPDGSSGGLFAAL